VGDRDLRHGLAAQVADHVDAGVAAAEHPQDRPVGQAGRQGAQQEPAQPVRPLDVVDQDQDRTALGQPAERGTRVFQQLQRAFGQRGQLAQGGRSQERGPSRPERREQRLARTTRLVRLGGSDAERGRLPRDRGDEGRLPDPGVPGDEQHVSAAKPAHPLDQRCRLAERVTATAQGNHVHSPQPVYTSC
jgi:hypothetical protein